MLSVVSIQESAKYFVTLYATHYSISFWTVLKFFKLTHLGFGVGVCDILVNDFTIVLAASIEHVSFPCPL